MMLLSKLVSFVCIRKNNDLVKYASDQQNQSDIYLNDLTLLVVWLRAFGIDLYINRMQCWAYSSNVLGEYQTRFCFGLTYMFKQFSLLIIHINLDIPFQFIFHSIE